MNKFGTFGTILFVLLFVNAKYPKAQETFWSKQEKIPEYYDATEEPPYLIADQNHMVHAFNSQPLDIGIDTSPKAMFYRQWTLDNGWTVPNDILYNESGGSIELVSVVSDPSGTVHLVFQRDGQDLYYVYTNLAVAGVSASWSVPQLIAQYATRIRPGIANIGAIAVDNAGNNVVTVYSGSEYGNGLYFVFSSDHGINWSAPYPIYLAGEDDLVVTDPELFVGQSGVFHAVWSSFKSDGFGGPGYYAAWDSEKRSWSNPIELDTPGIRTPSVVEYDGDVFVSYHHGSSNGNWWRRSSDYGLTWTTPVQVSPRHVGTNGGLSYVIDSDDTLHAFFGERIDDDNHGMWHIVWTGTSWTNAEAVVKGSQIRDVTGGNGFDPRSARAVVSNGNLLLVAWGTDGAAGENGAWYSYKTLNTPELPSEPLAVPSVATTHSETQPATNIVPEITPTIAIDVNNDYPDFLNNPQFSILLGVIPVILLLVGFIIVRVYIRSKHS